MALALRITSGSRSEGYSYEIVNPQMSGTLSYMVERGDLATLRDVREILDDPQYSTKIDLIANRADDAPEYSGDETFQSIASEYGIECPVLRG